MLKKIGQKIKSGAYNKDIGNATSKPISKAKKDKNIAEKKTNKRKQKTKIKEPGDKEKDQAHESHKSEDKEMNKSNENHAIISSTKSIENLESPIKQNNDVDKNLDEEKKGHIGVNDKIINPRRNSFRSGQLIYPTSGSYISSQDLGGMNEL